MVKCKLLKLNLTDLDTCKHPALPHTHKKTNTTAYTINVIVHAQNVHVNPPTHITVVVPDLCGLRASCSPLCILRHLRFSPLTAASIQPLITQTTRSVPNPIWKFFMDEYGWIFVFSSLIITFILFDFSLSTKYSASFYIKCPGLCVL